MKKIILITAICAISTQANSQWQLTGNAGTNASTNFIGTTDNIAFKIRTNNAVRMTINGSGKVGIGITSPVGKLHVKGNTNVSQLMIDASTTQSNTNPLIKLRKSDGTDLMWLHSDDTTNTFIGRNAGRVNNAAGSGIYNTFIGSNAGYSNTTGGGNTANGYKALYANTEGGANTANGYLALLANTSGSANTAIGYFALIDNTGSDNTAIGSWTLDDNTTGYSNTANGRNALSFNTTASENTAIGGGALFFQSFSNGGTAWVSANTAVGFEALYNNEPTATTTGIHNTAVGHKALYTNTYGFENTAIGKSALFSNGGGYYNTAIGKDALYNNIQGDYNTAVGNNADNDLSSSNDNTIIGANAHVGLGVSNCVVLGVGSYTQSANVAVLGSTTTQICGGYANWTNYVSDRRFKTEVQENVKGLDFIMRLRPVTYHMNVRGLNDFQGISPYGKADSPLTADRKARIDDAIAKKEAITMSGFIAQEVEKAAVETGYDFDGVKKPLNDKDNYGMSYATFVVPLVKAVQELNEELKSEVGIMKSENEKLKLQLAQMQKDLSQCCMSYSKSGVSSSEFRDSGNSDAAKLEQNIPNPFSENTVIKFYIPQSAGNSIIKIYSIDGSEIKSIAVSTKGFGETGISGKTLSAGTYTYMLLTDEKVVDTKQMVLTK